MNNNELFNKFKREVAIYNFDQEYNNSSKARIYPLKKDVKEVNLMSCFFHLCSRSCISMHSIAQTLRFWILIMQLYKVIDRVLCKTFLFLFLKTFETFLRIGVIIKKYICSTFDNWFISLFDNLLKRRYFIRV